MLHTKIACLAVWVVMFAGSPALPQQAAAGPEWVPLVLPWDDATPGPADLSFLNHQPAGKFGPVVAGADGHFAAGDQRIRFMGVNLCFAGTVPEKQHADKIAARMAKFGINAVRFHHMDGSDFPGGLIKRGGKHSGQIDPEALDRLDFLLSRLKAHGIYANVNLLVSRRFRSGDGLPAEIDQLDWKLRHAIAMYFPPMIELQKQYARDLLGHRNAHTGLALAADPAVAIVEINNENGLIQKWFEGDFDELPAPFADELARQWNAWLKRTYADTAAMSHAWQTVRQPLGREMFSPPAPGKGLGGWNLEQHEGAGASAKIETSVAGQPAAVRVQVERTGREAWHVQLNHPGLEVSGSKPYTLSFRARAEPARTVTLGLQQAHDPWGSLGLSRSIRLTPEWSELRFTFTPSASDGNARVNFGGMARERGAVWLAGLSLRPGGEIGPTADETLERASLPLIARSGPRAWPESARRDYVHFLRDTETAYWLSMRKTVKEELGFRGVVMGTIIGCSPPTVQAQLDAVDGHAYWQHPHFPGRPWDAEDWTVKNVSMVNEPGGVLAGLSMQRVAGKPFTVTEYNHSSPNSYGSEGPLLLAAQAALQDWDGIFLFAYSHSARWDSRRIDSFFDIGQHPTKMANLAAGALIYRMRLVAPGKELMTRELTPDRELDILVKTGRAWNLMDLADLGVPRTASLLHRTAIRIGDQGPAAGAWAAPAGRELDKLVSDTGEITWDRSEPGKGVVTINAPKVKAVIGFFGGRSFFLGGVNVTPAPSASAPWATACLAMLEGDSLSRPGRALLVMTGTAENTHMRWKDAQRSSVGRQWGEAPSRVEVIPATVRLLAAPHKCEVWALDERGQRSKPIALRPTEGGCLFVTGQQPTLWYEIVIR